MPQSVWLQQLGIKKRPHIAMRAFNFILYSKVELTAVV